MMTAKNLEQEELVTCSPLVPQPDSLSQILLEWEFPLIVLMILALHFCFDCYPLSCQGYLPGK